MDNPAFTRMRGARQQPPWMITKVLAIHEVEVRGQHDDGAHRRRCICAAAIVTA
jgi:hypothetical protein